jgi:hypothetical protein
MTLMRMAAVACAGALALVLSGSALAAYSPKLRVTPQPNNAVLIDFEQAQTDDPTARIVLYAPLGLTVGISQAATTIIGEVRQPTEVFASDIGGVRVPVTGRVEVADPGQYSAPPANLCTRTRHEAVWLLVLEAASQALRIPMYIDRPTGAEASFASLKITLCLGPPDVPPGTPGRAALGAKLLRANLLISTVFSGSSIGRWTGIFTPFTPNIGQANAAGSVEAQAIPGTASRVSISASLVKKTKTVKRKRVTTYSARITGTVPGGPRAKVTLLRNGRSVGTVTANANGGFSKTVAVTSTSRFQARATVAAADVTAQGCAPVLQNLPCVSVTAAGFTATSTTVTVVVRKPKKGG